MTDDRGRGRRRPQAEPAAQPRETTFRRRVSARRLAFDVLEKVDKGEPAERIFQHHPGLEDLAPRDRAFARLLYTSVLRRRGQLDALLAKHLNHPPKGTAIPNILRLGAAQLLCLKTPAHAALSETVGLAHQRTPRAAGLVNAVLRKLAAGSADALDTVPESINIAPWLLRSWQETYGEATAAALVRAGMAEPPLDVTVKKDSARWAERLGGKALTSWSVRCPAAGMVDGLPGFADGAWWVQDIAASLPARLLAPAPGERVLDMCAAPGGKTAQAALAGANVTAIEQSAGRSRLLAHNLKRVGLEARIVTGDARIVEADEPFDAVLLDAPCTATGTIRRHPDILWQKIPEDVGRLATLQSELLDAAALRVAPGGRLVYAVCSLQPEEGPAQVEAFLARHPAFRPLPIRADETGGLDLEPDAAGALRTLPSSMEHEGGMDGFYIARFERARN